MSSPGRLPATAQALVRTALRTDGGRDAVVDGRRRITYGQLADRTARLANCLAGLGAARDRPVAVLVGNRAEYIEVDVAATRAGIPRVGLSDRLAPEEWAYILEDARAAALVVTAECLERLPSGATELINVVVVDGENTLDREALGYEQALADASASFEEPTINASDTNYILYTSGTTGRPKGAAHSHAARAAAASNMIAFELQAAEDPAMLHVGPLTHGSGSKVLSFLALGGRNVIVDRFDVEKVADVISNERCSHSFMVPTMLQRIVESDPATISRISSLTQISFGGSPISMTLFEACVERFDRRLVQVYGSCEAPHPVTALPVRDHLKEIAAGSADGLLASAGFPTPMVDIRIVGEGGAVLGPDDVGELQISSPHLMTGYWMNEQASADAFTEDGWYATGDLAAVHETGFVSFHDRKRDLIISGGLNIYPSEVERVLLEHPGVGQAVVVGGPDDEWGESVFAYVVTRDPTVDEAELSGWVRAKLASYKKPRHFEFVQSLPMNSTGKVLREDLRAALWSGRERRIN
jgi:acyl-CoA synthetase (AMP-forming)/AMP-acid ligase II